jgi:WD repeat-containing protein 35
MLHKGMWFEEMINNRNKSVVRDMKWSADGQKICIVYEDGAVIVGSVDGNRLWGKELKCTLAFVEWSPDARNIIFITTLGEPYLYDNLGNRISKIPLYAVDDSPNNGVNIIGIHWYDGAEGHLDVKAPTLAIAFENGAVQVTRGEQDDNSVLIDTGMKLSQCKWNTNGSVLALAGSKLTTLQSGEERDVSMVQFYNPYGMHLRTLKVPGNGISALSWEGGGLRIALAVDSYIYFANIRPDYKWGYFGNTLVYSYNKPERPEHCVVFWDTKSDDKYVKYIKQLMSIHAAGENTVLVTQSEENETQHTLILCNAIGSPVDTKFIEMSPSFCTMTKYHVIVASEHSIYIWQYRTPVSKLTSVEFSTNQNVKSLRRKEGRERIFHIDDPASVGASDLQSYRNMNKRTDDPICCVAASETCLVVGRESGIVHRYTLPHISLETTYQLRSRPQKLALNCNSNKMSMIDGNGMLNFFDFEAGESKAGKGPQGEQLQFERKDAWDMMWAEDNPEQLSMMEKTRMYIFEGLTADEPVLSSGYLCEFKDLQVKAVMLDEIMQAPEQLDKEVVLEFESKSLRDMRELLGDVGIREAYQFIEDHPHPRLWRLLAEAALEELDLTVADKAFVRCADYQGIHFALCTMHCTLYSYTIYTVLTHCTLYSHTVHCTRTLYTVLTHCAHYTLPRYPIREAPQASRRQDEAKGRGSGLLIHYALCTVHCTHTLYTLCTGSGLLPALRRGRVPLP